jgi:twitching motility protein PilT
MSLFELLAIAVQTGCSDVHISEGLPPVMRKSGSFLYMTDKILSGEDTETLAREILNPEQYETIRKKGEVDLAISDELGNRFRLNVFMQKGNFSLAIRLLNQIIPPFEVLGLPRVVSELSDKSRGLVLVTGPTGSGKSTTLACMIDKINRERDEHIVTLEEPIEYLHSHRKSIVNQREIGKDTGSFAQALRAALRQDPDVILIGEMRDLETISIALTAAETGHLVISTLHTIGAAKTIDRVIDVFPPYQQQQVRTQLSTVLQGVISQQLIPRKDKAGRVAAVEVMVSTPAIRNLIREGKTFQIQNNVQTGAAQGMISMDSALLTLYRDNKISREDCLVYSVDTEYVRKEIGIR